MASSAVLLTFTCLEAKSGDGCLAIGAAITVEDTLWFVTGGGAKTAGALAGGEYLISGVSVLLAKRRRGDDVQGDRDHDYRAESEAHRQQDRQDRALLRGPYARRGPEAVHAVSSVRDRPPGCHQPLMTELSGFQQR